MPRFSAVIATALTRELARRRPLAPFAQLEIAADAEWDEIFSAARQLRAQYDPQRFHSHGMEAVAAAQAICELIEDAFRLLASEDSAVLGQM